MEKYFGTILIVAAVAGVLLVGAMRKKAEWLLNFVLRGILGAIVIYFVNAACAGIGIETGVGINGVTLLTSGILGFPGVFVLFGLGFYQSL